jgi:kynurenine formamidase
VVRVPHHERRAVTAEDFARVDVTGKAVLVHTGWAEHWQTPAYFEDFPFLTESAAQLLRDRGAALVGIDSHNIDDTRGRSRPVHSTLLRHDILIVEHLRGLEQLPAAGFLFSAVPPKIEGMGTFPVRAFAQLERS